MDAMVHPGPHAAPGWSQANTALADWLGCIGLSMLVTWQLPLSHLDRYRCVCAGLGHYQEIFARAAALTEAQIPAGLRRGLIADRGDPTTEKAGAALAACWQRRPLPINTISRSICHPFGILLTISSTQAKSFCPVQSQDLPSAAACCLSCCQHTEANIFLFPRS